MTRKVGFIQSVQRHPLPCSPILFTLASHWTAAGALSTDDAVSAALETVLYSQMLVLFAPQAVPAKSHLPVLVGCVNVGEGREVRGCELHGQQF